MFVLSMALGERSQNWKGFIHQSTIHYLWHQSGRNHKDAYHDRNVPDFIPAEDLCCMSFPFSPPFPVTFLLSALNKGKKGPKNNYFLKKKILTDGQPLPKHDSSSEYN